MIDALWGFFVLKTMMVLDNLLFIAMFGSIAILVVGIVAGCQKLYSYMDRREPATRAQGQVASGQHEGPSRDSEAGPRRSQQRRDQSVLDEDTDQPKFCSDCGAKLIVRNSKFCSDCGEKIH